MGKPSNRKRSARRLGKRERARVKKSSRSQAWINVGGASQAHVKAGRKKFNKVWRHVRCILDLHEEARLFGEPTEDFIPETLKSERTIRRPLYTIVLRSIE